MPGEWPLDARLGVVGGGQLGRMLGEAATPLGIELVVLDPTPEAPASVVARDQLVGDFDDAAALRDLAEHCDALTYEIELADPDLLEDVSDATGTPVHPSPSTLRMIEDKLVQKETLADAGIPVPPCVAADTPAAIADAGERFGYPLMLKARTGGYDGRGNVPVADASEIDAAVAELDASIMAEAHVDFVRELSVIGVRGDDERRTYVPGENIHEEEILRETIVPGRAPDSVLDRARAVADDVLDLMEGRGVFGIELFETRDGDILVNEIAPRPHNSGHWTIEGAVTSQFEQHVRAVMGGPLGTTSHHGSVVTANILGDVPTPTSATLRGTRPLLAEGDIHLHWYGKREVRPLRKMGHIAIVDTPGNQDALLTRARDVVEELTFRA